MIRVDGFRGGKLPPKSQIRGIRFRRDSFAAENHGGGLVFVDIMTSPGAGPLRGTADFTFRDESLNARNAFSPERSPEQQQNYGFTLNGTLVKNRTSFSLTSNGTNSYDSQTIYAVTASRHRRRCGPAANRPRQFVGARRSRVDEGLLVEGNVSAGDGATSTTSASATSTSSRAGTPGRTDERPVPVHGERPARPQGLHRNPLPGTPSETRFVAADRHTCRHRARRLQRRWRAGRRRSDYQ